LRSIFQEPTNPYGINKLLLSIVDKDMDETIIIEMAAENPPKNQNGQGVIVKNVWINRERYLHSDLFLQKDVAAPTGKTKILKVIIQWEKP
jgi:hypothetical protein